MCISLNGKGSSNGCGMAGLCCFHFLIGSLYSVVCVFNVPVNIVWQIVIGLFM